MTTYKFETVDTNVPSNPDDIAYALMGAFTALASTVAGKDQEKQAELFRKLDQALAYNEGVSCYTELARIAKATKASLIVTNGAKVIHIRRLKSDPGVNLLS